MSCHPTRPRYTCIHVLAPSMTCYPICPLIWASGVMVGCLLTCSGTRCRSSFWWLYDYSDNSLILYIQIWIHVYTRSMWLIPWIYSPIDLYAHLWFVNGSLWVSHRKITTVSNLASLIHSSITQNIQNMNWDSVLSNLLFNENLISQFSHLCLLPTISSSAVLF